MNKITGILIGIIATVLVVGGIYASMSNNGDVMMEKEGTAQQVMDNAKMTEENGIVEKQAVEEKEAMKKSTTSTMEEDKVMMKVGSYEAYRADRIARAETGDVVLFFHASWCPSCRGLDSSIESNLKSIPEGVTILKTDYDKEVELKKKYGVTYQHTLVQVDKDGNMIKKWSGGSSLDSLLSQIQ